MTDESRQLPMKTVSHAQRKVLRWMAEQYGPVIWYDGRTASKKTRERLTEAGLIRQTYSRRGNFIFELTPTSKQLTKSQRPEGSK